MRRRVLAVLLAGGLSGCGYALVGHGITVDPSIKRIGVPLFKDTTGKAGMDQKVTQKVIEELLKRGRFDVVQDAKGVDAVVEGELTRYTVEPIGFGAGAQGTPGAGATQASRYSITMVARLKYGKPGEKEPIWSNEAFSFRDEYDVSGDPTTFFDREDQSLDRLLTSFARSLVSTMLEAF